MRKIKYVVVVFDKKRLNFLSKCLVLLSKKINREYLFEIFISKNGNVECCHVDKLLKDRKLLNFSIKYYDDKYFDYSAYMGSLNKGENNDIIFINDTIASKHRSNFLIRKFINTVNSVIDYEVEVPVLVGPYSKSEFSFGKDFVDEFVSTYLFYINKKSISGLINVFKNLDNYYIASLNKDINNAYYGFSMLHSSQLEHRYEIKEKLHRKIATACMEREISNFHRKNGIIWYFDFGLISQTIIKLEKMLYKIFN